jgi:hypothetical protein
VLVAVATLEKNMKNQIAHITRRITIVAGLVAAFTLAPALSNIQSADAAPRDKRERKFERRQDKREKRFDRREDKREKRFDRRNRNNRWNNSSWNNRNNRNRRFEFNNNRNNRRYTTKYRTIWRNGKPYRQYYRVYY